MHVEDDLSTNSEWGVKIGHFVKVSYGNDMWLQINAFIFLINVILSKTKPWYQGLYIQLKHTGLILPAAILHSLLFYLVFLVTADLECSEGFSRAQQMDVNSKFPDL